MIFFCAAVGSSGRSQVILLQLSAISAPRHSGRISSNVRKNVRRLVLVSICTLRKLIAVVSWTVEREREHQNSKNPLRR